MNYKCVEVAFDKINKDAERGQTVNISIAAFTTCWERLRLYHHLDTVNLNALYPDTDSVVYKWWLGQPEIPLGNFLGEVTDELVSGGRMRDHIVNSSPVVLKTMGTGPRGERWVEQCTNSPSTYGGVRCSTLKAWNALSKPRCWTPRKNSKPLRCPSPTFIHRNPATKVLTTIHQDKTWGVIFDNSVVKYQGFNTFPNDYAWFPLEEE